MIEYHLTNFVLFFVSGLCMAINVVSVQHNGGFLPGSILLAQCYYLGEPV